MLINLNLRSNSPQRLFLDYLNSRLRQCAFDYTSSAGFLADGTFESSISGLFEFKQEKFPITWRMVKDSDGTLMYIEITCADGLPSSTNWELSAREIISSVLVDTLNQKRHRFFKRSFFCYIGTHMDGEYWLPGFRFAPAWPEDSEPHLIHAERVVSIDLEIDAIDDLDAINLAKEISTRHAARLSLLLDIGLYHHLNNHIWVIPKIDGRPTNKSERYQQCFKGVTSQVTEMPEKGVHSPLGKYAALRHDQLRDSGSILSLPHYTRKLYSLLDSNDHPEVTDIFDHAARLYQVAAVIIQQFPSVSLAYKVAAIELLSKSDKSCDSFSSFMSKYSGAESESNKFLFDYLYGKVRSSNFHGGIFRLGEYDKGSYFDPLIDADVVKNSYIHTTCMKITRNAIMNWILQHIPDSIEHKA